MIRRPPRSTRTDTLFPYTTLFRSVLLLHARVVLGGQHHSVDRDRLAVFVAQGDLRLRVRAQPRQRRVLLLAHLGLLLDQAMREMDRGGHVAARLVGGVAEHQALVAGALLFGLLAVDALVDVGGLLADQVEHARSEEQPSELQSLMRISYAVFCLKKKTITHERTDLCTLHTTLRDH